MLKYCNPLFAKLCQKLVIIIISIFAIFYFVTEEAIEVVASDTYEDNEDNEDSVNYEMYYYTERNTLPKDILEELEREDLKDVGVLDPEIQYLTPHPVATITSMALGTPNVEIIYPKHKVSEDIMIFQATEGMSAAAIEEIRCIARNVFHESANESYAGKLAVGNVTAKRKDNKYWPNTYCKVVKAGYKRVGQLGSCQFSWYCDGKRDVIFLYSKVKNNGKVSFQLNHDIYNAWFDSINIALDIYNNKAKDVTGSATHYYNPRICFKNSIKIDGLCHPPWAANGFKEGTMKRAESIYLKNGELDNHLFLIEIRTIE